VILWSLLPLLVAAGAVFGLGWFFWEPAVAGVRGTLEQWSLVVAFLQWLDSVGGHAVHALIAPLIVVALAVPGVVIASLLLVAWLATPAMVDLVAARRFPLLERKRGGGWFGSLVWSLLCTVAALAALILSIPLWFVPPLVLLLPPLIWGWLTYRVFAYDVLAAHASADERRRVLHAQRWPLLAIGIVSGYLGAAPSLLWAASAATLIFAPVLVVVSVWLYTLVFIFSACWFAHFALAALNSLRAAENLAAAAAAVPAPLPPPTAAPALPALPVGAADVVPLALIPPPSASTSA
jgi:hypothetical protein